MFKRACVAILIVLCLLPAGCSLTAAEKPLPGPSVAAGMGGGMGGDNASTGGMVGGFVAVADNCALELGSGSRVSSDGVSVARVVAPVDGWVVVSSALVPGRVLGKTWVPEGENRNVLVRLSAADGGRALVSIHVDRGISRVYEFDAARPLRSPDAQLFVTRTPVVSPVTLSSFGVDVLANSALLHVEDQPAGVATIRVAYVLVPGPSWISVVAVDGTSPVRVLGRTWRAAGEYQEIEVPLDQATSPGDVLVTVHQDAGVRSRFDFDPLDPLGSPDQPYKPAGEVVIEQIRLAGK